MKPLSKRKQARLRALGREVQASSEEECCFLFGKLVGEDYTSLAEVSPEAWEIIWEKAYPETWPLNEDGESKKELDQNFRSDAFGIMQKYFEQRLGQQRLF
jgi:hypothetical protein